MVDNIMSPVQNDVVVIKQAYLKGRENGWYYGDVAVINVFCLHSKQIFRVVGLFGVTLFKTFFLMLYTWALSSILLGVLIEPRWRYTALPLVSLSYLSVLGLPMKGLPGFLFHLSVLGQISCLGMMN